MNNDKPDVKTEEKGVSFWARVPPDEAVFAFDFRVALHQPSLAEEPASKPNNVSPTRPGENANAAAGAPTPSTLQTPVGHPNDVSPDRPVNHGKEAPAPASPATPQGHGGDVAPDRPVGKDGATTPGQVGSPPPPPSGQQTFFAGNVSPDRPVGHSIVPGSGLTGIGHGARAFESRTVNAKLDGGASWLVLTVPSPAAKAGDLAYEVEIGPLSFSQGWWEGLADFEGWEDEGARRLEKTGHGKAWQERYQTILVSLMSPDALEDSLTESASETGVFVWIKLAKPAPGDFVADFGAEFVSKSPGGMVAAHPKSAQPVAVSAADFPAGAARKILASVDVSGGTWTLYARGPAAAPAGHDYATVVGPRSLARSWMKANADTWTADAAAYALLTLTTRFDRL